METLRSVWKLRSGKIGLFIAGFSLFMALWGAFFPPYPSRAYPCLTSCPGIPPFTDISHFLGSYPNGLDVLNELLHGAPTDLLIGVGGAAVAMAIGVPIGVLAGQRRGFFGMALLGLTQVFLLMPTLVMVVWVLAFYGGTIFGDVGATNTFVLILGLFTWPSIALVARGEAMRIRELEYVQGAKAIGASDRRVAFRHILPNLLASVIPLGFLLVASNILVEFFLTYVGLGFGIDINGSSWGLLMQEGLPYLRTDWWISFFPGLTVVVVALGFVFLGDALIHVLNPKLRSSLFAKLV
jgi:peptide/nickel transport system permease protein